MLDIKFDETHNLVAFLEKPTKSEGFEEIIDFLNANPIKYALTTNPTIYTSCIQQFWATAEAKTINGVVQLQALVDGKKVIITEPSVRRVLKLKDAEGTDCLPNATIFEQLTLMGRVKKLEKKNRSRTHALKRLYKVGLSAKVISSDDEDLGYFETQGRLNDDNLMFDTSVLDEQEVKVENEVSTADLVITAGEVVTTANVEVNTDSATTTTIDELTLAQTLIEIKAAKPKLKGVMIQEPSEFTTATTTTTPAASKSS
ncbi:hypothetical protein Tco_0880834 [Tanacetum coccineum]